MADRKRKHSGSYAVGDWKHFARFGALVAAVAGTLVVGAFLESDDGARDGSPAPGFVEFDSDPAPDGSSSPLPPALDVHGDGLQLEAQVEPLEGAETVADASLDGLARRAGEDRQRLADAGGWTLQFMMGCDPANVAPRVAAAGDDDDFYLLPTWFDDRACFRICWGSYPSREAARAERRFPAALVEITDSPQPLPVEQALR